MKILGIETSCDETAISYINTDGKTVFVLGNCVNSQADLHTPYGGVFPTLAKREHSKNIVATFMSAMKPFVTKNEVSLVTEEQVETIKALLGREQELLDGLLAEIIYLQKPNIDAIAVTEGPGLEPALWVGINFAKALNILWNIPIIPMNHMEGHILVSLLKKPTTNTRTQEQDEYEIIQPILPALSLLISGGHTELVLIPKIGEYTIVGQTRDDAVGECFDKTARILGLPYPGGPKISALAKEAREQNIESPERLPRPMIHSKDLDFSFSGLKTAVLYLVQRFGTLDERTKKGIAREIEDSIVETVTKKTTSAIDAYNAQSLIIGGGVIANTRMREMLAHVADERGIPLFLPEIGHATDNALMIAVAAWFSKEKTTSERPKAQGGLSLQKTP
jgi:N6-L-threonylcarbamoyladenine synthase